MSFVAVLQAGEPFRVYIVIPMFPEGVPTSGSVQAILYYQAKTRQMMYRYAPAHCATHAAQHMQNCTTRGAC